MPRASRLAVALALLVLLAGCNTFGVPGTKREPFDVADPTTTPDAPGTASPVIAFDPVQNSTPESWDLLAAHFDSLEGRAYAMNLTRVERAANGTIIRADNWSTVYGSDHETALQTWTARSPNGKAGRQLYSNGTHVWIRSILNESDDGDPRLMVDANQEPVPPSEALHQVARPTLRNGLQSMNVTNVEALDTVPSTVDEPVFRVTATGVDRTGPARNQTRSNLTLIVSESGHIVEYYHEYAYVVDGELVTGQIRIEYRVFGVGAVDPPAWVPNGTPGTSVPVGQHPTIATAFDPDATRLASTARTDGLPLHRSSPPRGRV